MKGIVRIGGALVVGTFIILSALSVTNAKGADMSGSVIVATAPERNYIESKDSDGDGIKDWEEELGVNFTEVASESSSTSSVPGTKTTYVPPTTLTGKFSEAFFKDYLDGKVKGADFSNPDAFIGGAVTAIEKNTQSAKHSRLELTIVASNFDSLHTYGNQLAEIISKNSISNKNEVLILRDAVVSKDPSILASLEPIRNVYANIILDATHMQVPDSVIGEHLAFLNACEAILSDISAMQVAFTDPLVTLSRINEYVNDVKSLVSSSKDISTAFDVAGVSFDNNEPGAYFYSFDI